MLCFIKTHSVFCSMKCWIDIQIFEAHSKTYGQHVLNWDTYFMLQSRSPVNYRCSTYSRHRTCTTCSSAFFWQFYV